MNNQFYVDLVPGEITGVCYTPHGVDVRGVVVLLHGDCFGADVWTLWLDHFLTADYEVWCPNFPGYFGSTGEDNFHARKISVFEILNKIQKDSGDIPVFLLGHSSGGLVAQSVASGMTGLAGVVMLNSLPPKDMPLIRNHLLLKQMVKHSHKILLGNNFLPNIRDMTSLMLNSFGADMGREIYQEMTHVSGVVMREMIAGIQVPDSLNTASLVVAGEDDNFATWSMQKFMKEKYGSDLWHFPTGHLPMLEITESWLVNDIVDWMNEQIV